MSTNFTEQELEALKYPTGRRDPKLRTSTLERLADRAAVLEDFPVLLRAAVVGLNDAQLDTPYRPGGWTVRQLVHHIADSHAQALTRFKLALSEEKPAIKPYLQDAWVAQADAALPPGPSLSIIDGVHARLAVLVKAMSIADLDRCLYHPEQQRDMPLGELVELYTWHCGHHLAHITGLKQREGWK